MDSTVTAALTIILSALVATVTTLFVERTKLKYQLRVEHEYNILKGLWNKAYWLKSKANELRPQDQPLPTPAQKEQKLVEFAETMGNFERKCI